MSGPQTSNGKGALGVGFCSSQYAATVTTGVVPTPVTQSTGGSPTQATIIANGLWLLGAASYTGDSSNYFTITAYDCAAGQVGSGGTLIGTWSGQSRTLAAGTWSRFADASQGLLTGYTIAATHHVDFVWAKTGSVTTPIARLIAG